MFKRKISKGLTLGASLVTAGIVFILFWPSPNGEDVFRSRTGARHVQSIEFVSFRSHVAKDSGYYWRLRHAPETASEILASLPFHACDRGDTEWLCRMFAAEFGVQAGLLADYKAYRGNNASGDAEYILVAPDRHESFYEHIQF